LPLPSGHGAITGNATIFPILYTGLIPPETVKGGLLRAAFAKICGYD